VTKVHARVMGPCGHRQLASSLGGRVTAVPAGSCQPVGWMPIAMSPPVRSSQSTPTASQAARERWANEVIPAAESNATRVRRAARRRLRRAGCVQRCWRALGGPAAFPCMAAHQAPRAPARAFRLHRRPRTASPLTLPCADPAALPPTRLRLASATTLPRRRRGRQGAARIGPGRHGAERGRPTAVRRRARRRRPG
jgi:hypothetical protein